MFLILKSSGGMECIIWKGLFI